MDYSKPTLLVVSGPNGAGKSTHIQSMLPSGFEGVLPFDRDKTRVGFEATLSNTGVPLIDIFRKATEMMEQKLIEGMQSAVQL